MPPHISLENSLLNVMWKLPSNQDRMLEVIASAKHRYIQGCTLGGARKVVLLQPTRPPNSWPRFELHHLIFSRTHGDISSLLLRTPKPAILHGKNILHCDCGDKTCILSQTMMFYKTLTKCFLYLSLEKSVTFVSNVEWAHLSNYEPEESWIRENFVRLRWTSSEV